MLSGNFVKKELQNNREYLSNRDILYEKLQLNLPSKPIPPPPLSQNNQRIRRNLKHSKVGSYVQNTDMNSSSDDISMDSQDTAIDKNNAIQNPLFMDEKQNQIIFMNEQIPNTYQRNQNRNFIQSQMCQQKQQLNQQEITQTFQTCRSNQSAFLTEKNHSGLLANNHSFNQSQQQQDFKIHQSEINVKRSSRSVTTAQISNYQNGFDEEIENKLIGVQLSVKKNNSNQTSNPFRRQNSDFQKNKQYFQQQSCYLEEDSTKENSAIHINQPQSDGKIFQKKQSLFLAKERQISLSQTNEIVPAPPTQSPNLPVFTHPQRNRTSSLNSNQSFLEENSMKIVKRFHEVRERDDDYIPEEMIKLIIEETQNLGQFKNNMDNQKKRLAEDFSTFQRDVQNMLQEIRLQMTTLLDSNYTHLIDTYHKFKEEVIEFKNIKLKLPNIRLNSNQNESEKMREGMSNYVLIQELEEIQYQSQVSKVYEYFNFLQRQSLDKIQLYGEQIKEALELMEDKKFYASVNTLESLKESQFSLFHGLKNNFSELSKFVLDYDFQIEYIEQTFLQNNEYSSILNQTCLNNFNLTNEFNPQHSEANSLNSTQIHNLLQFTQQDKFFNEDSEQSKSRIFPAPTPPPITQDSNPFRRIPTLSVNESQNQENNQNPLGKKVQRKLTYTNTMLSDPNYFTINNNLQDFESYPTHNSDSKAQNQQEREIQSDITQQFENLEIDDSIDQTFDHFNNHQQNNETCVINSLNNTKQFNQVLGGCFGGGGGNGSIGSEFQNQNSLTNYAAGNSFTSTNNNPNINISNLHNNTLNFSNFNDFVHIQTNQNNFSFDLNLLNISNNMINMRDIANESINNKNFLEEVYRDSDNNNINTPLDTRSQRMVKGLLPLLCNEKIAEFKNEQQSQNEPADSEESDTQYFMSKHQSCAQQNAIGINLNNAQGTADNFFNQRMQNFNLGQNLQDIALHMKPDPSGSSRFYEETIGRCNKIIGVDEEEGENEEEEEDDQVFTDREKNFFMEKDEEFNQTISISLSNSKLDEKDIFEISRECGLTFKSDTNDFFQSPLELTNIAGGTTTNFGAKKDFFNEKVSPHNFAKTGINFQSGGFNFDQPTDDTLVIFEEHSAQTRVEMGSQVTLLVRGEKTNNFYLGFENGKVSIVKNHSGLQQEQQQELVSNNELTLSGGHQNALNQIFEISIERLVTCAENEDKIVLWDLTKNKILRSLTNQFCNYSIKQVMYRGYKSSYTRQESERQFGFATCGFQTENLLCLWRENGISSFEIQIDLNVLDFQIQKSQQSLRMCAFDSKNDIAVFDFSQAKPISKFNNNSKISVVTFSLLDSNIIYVGCSDGMLKTYKIDSKQLCQIIQINDQHIKCIQQVLPASNSKKSSMIFASGQCSSLISYFAQNYQNIDQLQVEQKKIRLGVQTQNNQPQDPQVLRDILWVSKNNNFCSSIFIDNQLKIFDLKI